jgi:hypothetical protein
MAGFQALDTEGGSVEDDGEFVVEIVSGRGGDGTCPIHLIQSFHASMLLAWFTAVRTKSG